MKTGLILLAAGNSTRLGRPKQLLVHHGRTLLRGAAEDAVASPCRPIVVVLGAAAECCLMEVARLPIRLAINTRWSEGLAGSVRTGLESLLIAMPDCEAAIISLCDAPLLPSEVFHSLILNARHTGCPLAAADYDGQIGVPALFTRPFFLPLQNLEGDEGPSTILEQHLPAIARVPIFVPPAPEFEPEEDYGRLVA